MFPRHTPKSCLGNNEIIFKNQYCGVDLFVTTMKLILICLYTLFFVEYVSAIDCLRPDGTATDWWVIYQLPSKDYFMYFDATMANIPNVWLSIKNLDTNNIILRLLRSG